MYHFVVCLILSLFISVSTASPLTNADVPEPLKPWINWVLQDKNDSKCPFFYNNFQQKHCSWPGKLSLDLKPEQAKFTSHWKVHKEDWIPLPGNQDYWPQNVIVNNKPALVMNKHGKPVIKLSPGSYIVKGDFLWDQIPESLTIPINTGLLSLHINAKNIPYPTIKNSSLWLKESDRGQKKPKSLENRLELQVFRKVYDHIPLQLMTFLELDVSGDQREIRLPHALLKNFIPISLNSPLPARIETDGSLLVQVRPGLWHIELDARHPKPITQINFDINDKHWPESEVWSFKAQHFLRLVEIIGLKTIDPSQTNVPAQWQNLPAYLLMQGDAMKFKVIRRGDPDPEPNQLRLTRQLWLDFDGEAYSVSDTISGRMTNGWRLNALPETQVGQVKLNGRNQLVTTSIISGKQGIELRKGTIKIQADSRINSSISNINAVGWEQNFHQLSAELNIPPGWQLLTAHGVDNVPDSWVSQWTLLDLFLVLIAALAICRLWNIYWGFFSLLTLALCWHETQAPHFIWLNILIAIALIRVLPEGKLQQVLKWYRNLCWFSLLLIVIPFMVSQVRIGLYPQLENQWNKLIIHQPYTSASLNNVEMVADGIESKEQDIMLESFSKMRQSSPARQVPIPRVKKSIKYNRIDPDANIQTGPGLPQWQWKKIHLSWNGSVDSHQQISLWYLSPTITMILNFMRVILVLVLSLLMLDLLTKKIKFSFPPLCWLIIFPCLGMTIQDVHADFPEQELLNELKERLLEAPECLPACAQITQMDLSINEQQMSIKLRVHAQHSVAIPLPAQLKQWFPNQVKIDNIIAQALIRTNDGALWLGLDKGLHNIELVGINPIQNKFSLPLPLKPHRTVTESKSWNIEGILRHGRAENQLLFTRLKTNTNTQQAKQKLAPGVLPPFIRIERTLHLGLDWRITTRVFKVFKNKASLAISFPLLKNESVTTANTQVKNKHVLINMSARQSSFQWESTLKKSATIELTASKTNQWTEIWRADVNPTWHIETSGLAVVHHQDHNRWLPEWRPWPGEKVSLTISRPKAVKGPTITIDKTELQLKPGKRSLETELLLSIRSSKGTQHTIILPEQAQLQYVKINGSIQPIRQKNTQVTLPIQPGKQNIKLSWHQQQDQTALMTTPEINIGMASVNTHLKVLLGSDRWVLFTWGPKFGPAVLIWGVLIVIVLFSIILGRIPITPLKHWHWFLLLLGLSQIPIASAVCVVVWLIALGIREKKQITSPTYFNTSQIGLGLLTLISLILLFIAVQQGLLGSPDMQITGNYSSAFNLNWYQDRNNQFLPIATVVSVPLMYYRVLMLLWSLWLAVSLLNWLKWGWTCFSNNGLWKKTQKAIKNPPISDNKTPGSSKTGR